MPLPGALTVSKKVKLIPLITITLMRYFLILPRTLTVSPSINQCTASADGVIVWPFKQILFPVKRSFFCIKSFYLSDTVHKQHIFFLSPSNCLDSCPLGNGTALSIGPELNTLLGLRRFWVSLALNQYQLFITV